MDEELERFKRLNLHEYAASLGYELDARETSRRETIMRKEADKISIRMDADGHYVFGRGLAVTGKPWRLNTRP